MSLAQSPDRLVSAFDPHAATSMRVLQRLPRGLIGPAALRLWNDQSRILGTGTPTFTLVLRDPALLRRLVNTRSPVLLADAYLRGQLDVEGDFYAAPPWSARA